MSRSDGVAIIGAGLAGLAAARRLAGAGWPVSIFDEGAAPGGRLASHGEAGWRFDHGGQFATARDPAFQAVLRELESGGHAASWPGRIVRLEADGAISPHAVERFVGLPCMDGLVRGLAAALPASTRPRQRVHVTTIEGGPGDWRPVAADGVALGGFARLVLAMPAALVAGLLRAVAPALASRAAAARLAPCWSLMLGFDGAVPDIGWDGAFLAGAGADERPLSWIAHDGSKPGRGGRAGWVAHGAPDWSARHSGWTAAQVAPPLRSTFAAATGIAARPVFQALHYWHHALPTRPLDDGFLWDGERGIGVAGDWCLAPRAEAAFLSGHHLAGAMGAA